MLRSTSFIFDGVPSETYNLMIYFLEDSSTRELELGTDVELIEDRIPTRTTPIHYGVDVNKGMSFSLTFGSTEYLEDYDVDAILSWLTGHQQYKWLEFADGDHYVRYKCHLNNMTSIYVNGLPFAFSCDVQCDSQFGYTYPTDTVFDIFNDQTLEVEFLNNSAYNGYLYPTMKIEFGDDCNSLSIINKSDNDREFKINSFDRVVINSEQKETVKETTLAAEIDADDTENPFISWELKTASITGDFEFIAGDKTIVALPKGGDSAFYSEDLGETWIETPLPYSGSWTGCYGENGFVAICTDSNTAIASWSQTGHTWSSSPRELPVHQNWSKVFYVETDSLFPNEYVAISSDDTNVGARSTNGQSWVEFSFPISQVWQGVFSGNGIVYAVGGNSNIAATSLDCQTWTEYRLPKEAAWMAGCYGTNGFLIVCDSLYGAGSQENIALTSLDGKTWNEIEFPVGSWSDAFYNSGIYVAIADKKFARSLDNSSYSFDNLPTSGTRLSVLDSEFICSAGSNKYLATTLSSTIEGSFTIPLSVNEGNSINNVYVLAEIQNNANDNTYSSLGSRTLATYILSSDASSSDDITGGNNISLAKDLRNGDGIDGATLSAVYNPEICEVEVGFIVNKNHTGIINAPLMVTISYQENTNEDLGYEGLIFDFDNQNQIITTNKTTLNPYQYFNMKFFRLAKGVNDLVFDAEGGSCKVILTCEFLRKVGGR